MAWPPPVLPATRSNQDPQWDTHAADHNALAQGANDIVARLNGKTAVRKQGNPNGSVPTATWTRLTVNAAEYSYGEGVRGDSNGVFSDVAGMFLLMGTCYWLNSNGTGRRLLGVSTSSTTGPTPDNYRAERGVTAGQVQQVVTPFKLTAPGQFHLWCYQDSGATITLNNRTLAIVRLTHPF